MYVHHHPSTPSKFALNFRGYLFKETIFLTIEQKYYTLYQIEQRKLVDFLIQKKKVRIINNGMKHFIIEIWFVNILRAENPVIKKKKKGRESNRWWGSNWNNTPGCSFSARLNCRCFLSLNGPSRTVSETWMSYWMLFLSSITGKQLEQGEIVCTPRIGHDLSGLEGCIFIWRERC